MTQSALISFQGKQYGLYPAGQSLPEEATAIRYLSDFEWEELAEAICASGDTALHGFFAAPWEPRLTPQTVMHALKEGAVQLARPKAEAAQAGSHLYPMPPLKPPVQTRQSQIQPQPESAKRVVPVVPEPAREARQPMQIVVEIAGQNLDKGQSILLYRTDQQPSVNANPVNDNAYRSLATLADLKPGSYQIGLCVAMQGTPSQLILPLAKGIAATKKSQRAEEWDTVLIPIKPLQFLDDSRDRSRARLPQAGWLYLFWQGKLWRELQVMDNGALRDVRLDYYRNAARFGLFEGADAATRKAEGRWLTDVWVPYKIAGAYQTGAQAPRIAFSKSQWDWAWVEKLETDGAALVEETLALESLQAYSRQRGFEDAGELDDIQAATTRMTGVSQRTLSQHPARKIPVVYLPALPDNSLTFQLPMAESDDDEPRSIRLSLLHDDSPWHQTQTGEVDADGRLVVGFDGLPKKGAFTLVTLPDGQAVDPIILFRGKSVEEIRQSYPSEEGSV